MSASYNAAQAQVYPIAKAAPSPIEAELAQDPLALEFAEKNGEVCALKTFSKSHLWILFVLFEIGLYCGLHGFRILLAALMLSLTGILLATIAFRLFIVLVSLIRNPQIVVQEREIQSLDKNALPIYTILVPLYKEANVAEGIVSSLDQLEYPRDRLDIKLLLEADDHVTVNAVEQLSLAEEYDVILVPPGLPRTKPKACNYGLRAARGDYVVIFDAEDRPEPDQLLKVIHAFQTSEESTVCIQAKLNYYNPRENLLTRFFAIEYTAWFDLVLPGIQSLNGPIPLGGTSNHFRTEVLQEIGGWDPYNVTEDCDLGVRLATSGYRTKLIDSTTWEEANNEVGNWIRQRSRWVKGYLQTHFIHTKTPFGLFRKLGARSTLLFYFCITSVPVQQLLNLLCWPATLLYGLLLLMDVSEGRDLWIVMAGSRDEYRIAWKMLFTEPGESPIWSWFSVVGFICSICMLLANLLFIVVNLLACRLRNYGDLWGAALLSPFYWLLASVAAWKGAIQLVLRPHYWEKTVHGLTQSVSTLPNPKESANP